MSEFYPHTEDSSPICSPTVSNVRSVIPIEVSSETYLFVVSGLHGSIHGVFSTYDEAIRIIGRQGHLRVSRLVLNRFYDTETKQKDTQMVDVVFPSGCIGC